MKEEGYALASLYAFRESYYRNFGYEVCGKRWQIQCPNARLPKLKVDLPVYQIAPENIVDLEPIYRAFADSRSGMNIRTPDQFRNRLGKKPPMIYALGDPMEAYAWSGMEGMFWDDLRIGEFVWSTARGYESMLAFLTGLAINRSALIWYEPSDSPFIARHLDQGIKVSLERNIMFRTLNVEACLRTLRTSEPTTFCLRVDDVEMENNRIPWKVSSTAKESLVERGDRVDMDMDIGSFTQCFLGDPSFATLADAGAIRLSGADARRAGELAFPARPVNCYDFF